MWERKIRRYDFLHHIDGEVVVFGILSGFFVRFCNDSVLWGKLNACIGNLSEQAFNYYQNKHLTKQLERKEQECVGHKEIIAQGEQRLFAKTQKVLQEWLKQWDEGVRLWERDVLGIKNPREDMKFSGDRLPLVKDICVRGEYEVRLLYRQALEKNLLINITKKYVVSWITRILSNSV
ncbi:hypothetical protein [Bartonella sp. TS25HLJMH]|uniref:hypothetical protein n=1 Tax=Bartonella sp. TS25HLJMH TaxID=3243576 RepID=UPI0035CFD029